MSTPGARLSARPRPGGRLAVRVDGPDHLPVSAARVYITGADGRVAVPEGATGFRTETPFGREEHAVAGGRFEVDIPPGPASVRVERGAEFVPDVVEISVGEGRRHELRLSPERWVDMRSQGWLCGDLHCHRDPADVPLVLSSEELDFGSSIATHNGGDVMPRADDAPPGGRWAVEGARGSGPHDTELERIDGGPGAIVGLGLTRPLRFDCTEWTPLDTVVADWIRELGGIVDAEKPFWPLVPALAALGKIDSIGLACNHLGRTWTYRAVGSVGGVEPDNGIATGARLVDWISEIYHRLLNCGFALPVTGGSASGWMPNPVGHGRTYVTPADARDGWAAALRRGRSFATTGPMLSLDVDGCVPGDRAQAADDAGRRHAAARAVWWRALDRLEVIHNGEVIAEGVPASGVDRRELRVTAGLPTSSGGWVAARAVSVDGDRVDFGHTSPVWLAGPPARRRGDDAAWLRKWLERWGRQLRRSGRPRPPPELFDTLRTAQDVYRRLEG